MERKTDKQKHLTVSVMLEELLSRLSPGGRLPGSRELMLRSGCSRPVVEAELARCVALGKIAVMPRCGFFKTGSSVNPRKVAILHSADYPADGKTFVDILFNALRFLIEQEHYEAVFIHYDSQDENFFHHLTKTLGADKLIFIGCDSKERAKTAHQLFPHCMELLPRHDGVFGAEIRDSEEMTAIQLNYLFQRKFTKIGYLHHVEKESSITPVEYRRLFDYYRIMAEHGLRVNPEWVQFASWEWKLFEHAMEKFFSSGDVPEAVIVPGSSLEFFYRYCSSRGIEIGKEIGVMGCDAFIPGLKPEVTTITNAPQVIAEDAWHVMKELLAGNILQQTTTLHVRPGNSIQRTSIH